MVRLRCCRPYLFVFGGPFYGPFPTWNRDNAMAAHLTSQCIIGSFMCNVRLNLDPRCILRTFAMPLIVSPPLPLRRWRRVRPWAVAQGALCFFASASRTATIGDSPSPLMLSLLSSPPGLPHAFNYAWRSFMSHGSAVPLVNPFESTSLMYLSPVGSSVMTTAGISAALFSSSSPSELSLIHI